MTPWGPYNPPSNAFATVDRWATLLRQRTVSAVAVYSVPALTRNSVMTPYQLFQGTGRVWGRKNGDLVSVVSVEVVYTDPDGHVKKGWVAARDVIQVV